MPRTRTRSRLALALGVLLAGTLVTAPADALGPPAAAAADYTITVDPARTGPAIADSMYGVFYEDINRAADGGLYAELVQNRSFEYDPADNRSYTPLTAWSVTTTGGARGSAQVVDDAGRLGEKNRRYLRLKPDGNGGAGARYGVTNAGYLSGISVREGKRYDFSLWARTDRAEGTPLTVELHDAAGTAALAQPLTITARGDSWKKYTGTFTARTTSTAGRLSVAAGGAGTIGLDMVSLFPRDTYKGRPNGMRKDLAEKTAALKPGFLRFPGGCLVNTGSHEAYEAPNWPRKRSYQWKETIGPVEERPTNWNFWGYNQSYGIGYLEYFKLAEDLHAEPLPVLSVGANGCGSSIPEMHDPAMIQRWVDDTVDLIEFANGGTDTEWGAKRAALGHPEPFGLDMIGLGNEENTTTFEANFPAFRDAVKAKYPDIKII